jgi:hypothetical protein
MTWARQGRRLGFDRQLPQEDRCRFKGRSNIGRSDSRFLEGFQPARAIAQHVPCGDGDRPLDLRCGQTPAFSVITGGPVNKAFGNIIAVASSGLRRSLHVERLTICVEQLSRQRTRNRSVRSSTAARRFRRARVARYWSCCSRLAATPDADRTEVWREFRDCGPPPRCA